MYLMKKRTWHEHHADTLTASERAALAITSFSGTMKFIYIHAVWWTIWFLINSSLTHFTFDEYPYNLLTMVLSLEAILLGTFILIGQNLQTKRDKIQAEHDRETVAMILEEVKIGHQLIIEVKEINQKQNKILEALGGKKHV